jgi:hypothetical protein
VALLAEPQDRGSRGVSMLRILTFLAAARGVGRGARPVLPAGWASAAPDPQRVDVRTTASGRRTRSGTRSMP